EEPEAQTSEQMRDQARRLLGRGPGAVLLKGGHGSDGDVTDILATRDGQIREFTHPRLDTPNTHGTGCTLSAAITAEVAVRGRERAGAAGADGADPEAGVDGGETAVSAAGADVLGDAVSNALDFLARALAS